jgi:hypothetical protein
MTISGNRFGDMYDNIMRNALFDEGYYDDFQEKHRERNRELQIKIEIEERKKRALEEQKIIEEHKKRSLEAEKRELEAEKRELELKIKRLFKMIYFTMFLAFIFVSVCYLFKLTQSYNN